MSHSFHHSEIIVKFHNPFFLSPSDCYFQQKQGISLQLSPNTKSLSQIPSKPATE